MERWSSWREDGGVWRVGGLEGWRGNGGGGGVDGWRGCTFFFWGFGMALQSSNMAPKNGSSTQDSRNASQVAEKGFKHFDHNMTPREPPKTNK